MASLIVPLPILVIVGVELVLDATNPKKLDITQEFAYSDAKLFWGFGTLAIMIALVAVMFVRIYRRENDLRPLGLPLAVVALQLLMWIFILLVSNITSTTEDDYRAASFAVELKQSSVRVI